MAKTPEGHVRVRAHFRRRPRPAVKKLSGWTIAGLVAAVWLWGQLFGFETSSTSENHHPSAPEPSVTASAGR